MPKPASRGAVAPRCGPREHGGRHLVMSAWCAERYSAKAPLACSVDGKSEVQGGPNMSTEVWSIRWLFSADALYPGQGNDALYPAEGAHKSSVVAELSPPIWPSLLCYSLPPCSLDPRQTQENACSRIELQAEKEAPASVVACRSGKQLPAPSFRTLDVGRVSDPDLVALEVGACGRGGFEGGASRGLARQGRKVVSVARHGVLRSGVRAWKGGRPRVVATSFMAPVEVAVPDRRPRQLPSRRAKPQARVTSTPTS